MKIMMLGDVHGDTEWAVKCIKFAKQQGAHKVFQLGDFGIWGGTGGAKFVDKVSNAAVVNEIDFVFLDGNHENFDKLRKWSENKPVSEEGFVEIRDRLFHSPRGNIWTWGQRRFLSMGGAVSVDRQWRVTQEALRGKPRTLWWEEEEITQADVDRVPNTSVDVLLSHDSVINPLPKHGTDAEYKMDAMSMGNRDKLKEVFFKVRPTVMFHGHYHYFHHSVYHKCQVIGLENERYNRSWAFLTVPQLKITTQ